VILFSLSFQESSVFAQTGKKLTARDLFLSTETPPVPSNVEANPGPSNHVKGTNTTTSGSLALRCSIVKQVRDNQVEDVDPETIFHSGDRIRLRIESNHSAYLYVVSRGSSGGWKLLFPSTEISDGKNTIEKGERHEIPLGDVWIAFDTQPGIEKLFLVLSRQREPDLEKLIRVPVHEGALVSALDNSTVSRIRGQVARDLVFENVSKGDSGEKAIYAATKPGNPNSKVVVDLNLTHR